MPALIPDVYTELPNTIYVPNDDLEERMRNAFAKHWNVVVWNDDIHTFDYVIEVLMKIVGINESDAFKHAHTIHTAGKSIVATTTQERAELYHEQLIECELTVTLEKMQ